MANKDDYLTYYREFFENFAQTINPDDQLPVKLSSYKLVNVEVVGAIIDWTTQYLTQKKCPLQLISPLIKIVIDEIRKACKKQPIECGFNPTDNAYEPLKLMQTVMSKINEICLRYLDNSMLCSLPSSGNAYFATSVCAVRNKRRRMEDRHVVIHDLNTMFNIQEASPSSYYAIFDGHAGFHAATYSSTHLHQFLAESEHFIVNPEQALVDAFLKTDSLFIEKRKNESFSSMSCSGTTAVVALLRPKEKTLYVAWVGDSQALLVNQGRVLQIVNPHKPSRQDERERIEKEGGRVMVWGIWRVDGQLAVSRAIGDAEYKPYVTAMPDIREISLDGGEDFLILACDGLWDVVSEDCAARTVYNLIAEDSEDTDRIGPHLVQIAKAHRSTDNISVIVVFLREPSKIAAEAHWANRNCPTSNMETTGLDNANNPFTLSNGATNDIDNVISTQKGDGLLLNLTDNFKQNGTDLSPTDFFRTEKSNGKRSASEFDDEDDFGPETNVDTVDDVLSPTSKKYEDNIFEDKAFEGHYNPFMDHQEKAALEIEKNLPKKDEEEKEEELNEAFEKIHDHEDDDEEEGFGESIKEYTNINEKEEFQTEFQQQLEDTQRMAREETPTPPADTVHNVSGLVDNAAESESEDEWNYIKGEVANKENIPPQPEKEVAEIPEEDDSMSQLNPNAAEFVPVSPTSTGPSPLCRSLLNDEVIAQSPIRASHEIDINLPNPKEFENEVKSRPSEVDSFNGHGEDLNKSSDLIDNLLNGKNIDEIPEFQPGSTPKKSLPTEEFHFGPNAVQFTPAKLFDQSEAGISTRAVFGDESVATIGTSFNESAIPEVSLLNKESDPMSMSFYEDRDNNLFDLNKVQMIPDNIDEFLKQPEVNNSGFNETISDLPEHHPLGESEKVTLNNDDAIQVTDLDKQSYDDEKELASPLEPGKELLEEEDSEPIRTPEPTHENLLGMEFCCIPKQEKQSENLENMLDDDVEVVSPENGFERRVATEVDDLLQTETVTLPPDVEMIPPELNAEVNNADPTEAKPPVFDEREDLVCERPVSKSPELEAVSPGLVCERPESGSLVCKRTESGPLESKSPVCERPESQSPVCSIPESKSPINNIPESESLVCERPELNASVCERPDSKSPLCERPESKSPVCDRPESQSSVCEQPMLECKSPVCEKPISESPIPSAPFDRTISTSPLGERPESHSPICERDLSSPICPLPASKMEFGQLDIPKSPVPHETGDLTPDFTSSQLIEEAQKAFEDLCHPSEKVESPQEDVTSSVKDDISSPSPDHFVQQSQEIQAVIESNIITTTEVSNSFNGTSVLASDFEDSLIKHEVSNQNSILPVQIQGEEIDVKTDKITPEFAEQAVITPSEESKQEDICSLLVEETKKEPEVKPISDETIVGVTAGAAIGVVAAATAVAATAKTPDTKVSEKKSATSATKKTTPRVGSASKTTPKASPASALTNRSASSKPAAPKPGATKTPTGTLSSRPTSAATKPPAKPKTATTTLKAAEKKPLTNGDIKSTVKSTLTAKKETTTTKSASSTTKLSPTKPTPPKTSPLPKTTLTKTAAPKPFTAKPAPATTRPPLSAPKRPTTLSTNKTAAPTKTASLTSTVTAKPSVTKTSPKVPSAPRPKPPTTTTTAPKPRVPLTRPVAKAPDTEKQNKESANKITASKSATGTVTSKTIGATRMVASSTARRVESKTSASRTTVSKTTTTTMKSTTGKKPMEIVRNATANKTKTTKIEKPKENGESTIVTEELTTVVHTTNNSIAAVDGEPQLIKDNSPLDNKLIIDSLESSIVVD